MEIKNKSFQITLSNVEVVDLEQEFFTLMSNYKNFLKSEGIEKFKKDYSLIYELYELIRKKRE